MFGLRQDNRSSSQRALVPVTEPINDGEVGDVEDVSPDTPSYFELLQFARRKKFIIGVVATATILFVSLFVTLIVITKTATPVINPTTPIPLTTTTTSTTTPSTTTTTPTTTTPTTTTTSPTTTTPTTTTTSTTTKPTTTTSKSTTTTSTTTESPSPRPPVPTTRPLPPHPEKVPATTLLQQVGLTLNWTQVPCLLDTPPTFKYILLVDQVGRNYTGESDSKHHARNAASMNAVWDLFGVKYNQTMPPPPNKCRLDLTAIGTPYHVPETVPFLD